MLSSVQLGGQIKDACCNTAVHRRLPASQLGATALRSDNNDAATVSSDNNNAARSYKRTAVKKAIGSICSISDRM